MTDLSGAGVRVLLIATATHDGPTLPAVPSVTPTFHALRTALTERCGVPDAQLRAELDLPDAKAMAKAVAEEAQQADTVLLVYFIGHGLLDTDGELYLAARTTDRLTPGMAGHEALSFSALRQALTASRASCVVLVLDCCFSGRATLGRGTSVPAFSMDPAPGIFFIGSAEQLALAPPDAERTAFTGALIDVLTHGDPRGPHHLTLDLLYDAVFRAMQDRQLPLPRRQSEGRSGSLVVAPNPAVPEQRQPPEEPKPAQGRCPYPGLESFGPDDAGLFCGRERMVEQILSAMAKRARTSDKAGPLVLVGPSGSGKTSLLNAGLLSRLRDNGLPGSAGWPVLRLTPNTDPLRRLALHLDAPPHGVELLLEAPERAADWVDRLLTGRSGRRLVVLVDQLEELFTLCGDETERTAFLRALTAIAASTAGHPPQAIVVLALRADFYAQAAAHPELLAALRDRQLLVEPMTPDELRAAIEQPATRTGLGLDDGLAELMLHELGAMDGGQPAAGALPLLSHALWATWRECGGSRLTFAGYRATGGISHAITTTADAVYDALDPEGKKAAKHLLTRLVRVGDGSADTGQPLDRSTLVHGLPDDAARQALDLLVKARLITLDQDTARISHEALIRAWPLLQAWLDADREWLRDRQRLADDASAWELSERDPSLLYRGNRLATVHDRAAGASVRTEELDPLLAEFMETSTRQERRGVRRRRTVLAFVTVLAVLASAGLIGSIVFQRQAERAHQRDLARYLAAEAEDLRESQPGLAKQLSLLSYRIDRDAGRGALMNSQRTPGVINGQEAADDLAYNADGRILAISTGDSIMLRTGSHSERIKEDTVGPITLSRDGRTLAAVTYDSSQSTTAAVRLWDIANPAHPRQTASLKVKHITSALALSTDGSTLFAGTSTGEILLWSIEDRTAPAALPTLHEHSKQIDSLAISSKNDLFASMSVDGRIILWNVAEARHPRRVGTLKAASYPDSWANKTPLHRVAFDRTGQLLAAPVSVRSEDDLGLWRLNDPRSPRQIHKSEDGSSSSSSGTCLNGMTSLAFSPARDHIVGTCGGDWHAWVYATDPAPGLLVAGTSISGQGGYSYSGTVLFDPGKSRRLLLTTERGVQVWYLSNAAQPGANDFVALTPGTGGQLSFRTAGNRQLLAMEGVGVNYLVDVTKRRPHKLLATTPAPNMFTGSDIDLSPDGRILADVEVYKSKGKTRYVGVRLRDTAHPKRSPLATIGDELQNGVQVMAFSPTKPLLAVSDMNGWIDNNHLRPTVRLFDIADVRHPRQVAQIRTTSQELAFSPDGKTLITDDSPLTKPKNTRPTAGMQLKSWDVTDPAHPTQLWARRLTADVDSAHLAFRPDGKLLAIHQSNGKLQLWRIDRDRPSGSSASVTVGQYGGPVTFTPDGTHIALIASRVTTGSDDGYRPEIWDLTDPNDPTLESYLPGGMSALSSIAFSPDGQLLAVVRASAGIDLWDITPTPLISDLCNSVGDPITRQQWKRYLPDRAYRPPCQ